ncbi:hypothetical protein [Actinoplanes nipponensis]|uniref:hypothetical protein n=1 Tax=Actinoplanes nipponensis TaxID=135950 RepID=UPI0031E8EA54
MTVHPLLGGLLLCWQRARRGPAPAGQDRAARQPRLGRYDLPTGRSTWSPGMYRIFEREPGARPMSRPEQAAMLVPADAGLTEAAGRRWTAAPPPT